MAHCCADAMMRPCQGGTCLHFQQSLVWSGFFSFFFLFFFAWPYFKMTVKLLFFNFGNSLEILIDTYLFLMLFKIFIYSVDLEKEVFFVVFNLGTWHLFQSPAARTYAYTQTHTIKRQSSARLFEIPAKQSLTCDKAPLSVPPSVTFWWSAGCLRSGEHFHTQGMFIVARSSGPTIFE